MSCCGRSSAYCEWSAACMHYHGERRDAVKRGKSCTAERQSGIGGLYCTALHVQRRYYM